MVQVTFGMLGFSCRAGKVRKEDCKAWIALLYIGVIGFKIYNQEAANIYSRGMYISIDNMEIIANHQKYIDDRVKVEAAERIESWKRFYDSWKEEYEQQVEPMREKVRQLETQKRELETALRVLTGLKA